MWPVRTQPTGSLLTTRCSASFNQVWLVDLGCVAGIGVTALGVGTLLYTKCDDPCQDIPTIIRVAKYTKEVDRIAQLPVCTTTAMPTADQQPNNQHV
jgi:hypothetical protein